MTKSTLCAIAMLIAGTASASDIYKWTDENGNVHYGDRPDAAAADEVSRIAIASRRTDAAAVSAAVEARRARDADRAEARSAREEAEQKAAEEREAAEAQAAQCAEYRSRLESYVTARRLYKLDDEGERVYLDDGQMDAARAALEQRIADSCSG